MLNRMMFSGFRMSSKNQSIYSLSLRTFSVLTESSKWEIGELSELFKELKLDLEDASDGHAFPEEIEEALLKSEDFLHRHERFVQNLTDEEKKEVNEHLGLQIDTVKVLRDGLNPDKE